jgi:hypothetical protein
LLAWRLLEDLGDAYLPDMVVYCLDMTDFHDDLRYQSLLARRGVFWFYDKVPITLRLLERRLPVVFDRLYRWSNPDLPEGRFFHSEQPLTRSAAHLSATVENLQRLHDWSRRRGAAFVLVVLPRGYQYDAAESPRSREAGQYTILGPYSHEPFRFFAELQDEVEYPILSLLPAFRDTQVFPTCFEDDPHWNPAGHRVAAEALVEALVPLLKARG